MSGTCLEDYDMAQTQRRKNGTLLCLKILGGEYLSKNLKPLVYCSLALLHYVQFIEYYPLPQVSYQKIKHPF